MNNVPNEILTQIIESLYEDSVRKLCCPSALDSDPLLANLRNVRLVCRSFKGAAANIFGDVYFTSREVILEKSSLETLRSIAMHKELRKRVTHLTVNTFQFPAELTEWVSFRQRFSSEVADEHPTFLNTADENGAKPFEGVGILVAHAAYKQLYKNQKKAKSSGAYTAMLAECLEYLKKGSSAFKSLSLSGHDRTPALRHITSKIGLDGIQWCPEMGRLITEATCMVMQAVFWSRVKLCSFALECCGEEQLLLPSRALKNLKAADHIHNLRLELKPQAINEDGVSFVYDIIQACPNIQQLEICFPGFMDQSLDDAEMFFGSKCLQHLQHLHLYCFPIPAQELANVLYRHRKTLKCLELENMILSTGRWTSIFKFVHDHLELEEFGGHNLFEHGMRNYHRPDGDLLKYILNEIEAINWCDVAKNYLTASSDEEGMFILANQFGEIAQANFDLIDELFGISSDTVSSEPELLEIPVDEEEENSHSGDWTSGDDDEFSDNNSDSNGEAYLPELSDSEIEDGDENVDDDDDDDDGEEEEEEEED